MMTDQSAFKQLIDTAGIELANSTAIYPQLHQPGDAGLPLLLVENRLGRAVIALQGAHLLAFRPAGRSEMLWLSPKCVLQAGKPIRGGIPLCLPWFGAGPDGQTMHGFARTLPWSLVSAGIQDDGATCLTLELAGDASLCALWPHAFAFRLDVVVGAELKLRMTAENRGARAAPLAFAFHTYFAVADVAAASVTGLEGTTFIDKTDGLTRKTQHGAVTISALTDRVYLDVPARQTLQDAAGEVAIEIECDASCAVVWNAWNNDANIADLGAGNHVGYLCVERGDVADRAVTLAPGAAYRTTMTLA
jgi:D-hexose-6-phosphate mutarotase